VTIHPQRPDARQQQIAAFYASIELGKGPRPIFIIGRTLASLRARLKAGVAQIFAGTSAGFSPEAPAADGQQAAAASKAQKRSNEGSTVREVSVQRTQPTIPRASWWTRYQSSRPRRGERPAERRQQSRARRVAKFSGKVFVYSCALVYGVGNLTEPLAATILQGGTSVADAFAAKSGIMITGNGTRPVFVRPPAADPNDPSRAHLPEAGRQSEQLKKTTYMAIALEDKRALAPAWSFEGLTRVHGTDTLSIGKAVLSQVGVVIWPDTKRRGGSTVPVTTCSIALGSMAMPDGIVAKIKAKFDEHLCAARLEGETGGDTAMQAGMMLDNAALVIGGGADTQGLTLASWQLFSRDFTAIDQDCHLAVMAAAVNLPFLVPGKSLASQEAARSRLDALRERAQIGLEALRAKDGLNLKDDDRACLAALPALLDRRFRNPAGSMNRAFGAAAAQIAAEAFTYRVSHPGTVQLTARFDAGANESAMQRVGTAACAIAHRKAIRLNICPEDGPIAHAQVRVIAMHLDGAVHRLVAIGVGAASVLQEREDGQLPGRGSVGKGILLPILKDNLFCRFDYANLADADGVAGVDHDCRRDELTPASYAVKASLNQPFLYALEHTDREQLARYRNALGLRHGTLRDLVVGSRPAATQILLRDYGAVTSIARIGTKPHFMVETGSADLDLSALISTADVTRTRQLLAEPLKPGGTAHAAAVRLQAAGYSVAWGKSGTSEAGFGTEERGKHLILEMHGTDGRPLIVFAEIASADSTAISASGVLSSADLAEIILATLQPEK
jgi:hypothetical protein